jgi:hypothetical protein
MSTRRAEPVTRFAVFVLVAVAWAVAPIACARHDEPSLSATCAAELRAAMSGAHAARTRIDACPAAYRALIASFDASAAMEARKRAGVSDAEARAAYRAATAAVVPQLTRCTTDSAVTADIQEFCRARLRDREQVLGDAAAVDPTSCSNLDVMYLGVSRTVSSQPDGKPYTDADLATARATVVLFDRCLIPLQKLAMRATSHAYLGIIEAVGNGRTRDRADAAHEFALAEGIFRACIRNVDPSTDLCRKGLAGTQDVAAAYK